VIIHFKVEELESLSLISNPLKEIDGLEDFKNLQYLRFSLHTCAFLPKFNLQFILNGFYYIKMVFI